jgi:hypothetical protein
LLFKFKLCRYISVPGGWGSRIIDQLFLQVLADLATAGLYRLKSVDP